MARIDHGANRPPTPTDSASRAFTWSRPLARQTTPIANPAAVASVHLTNPCSLADRRFNAVAGCNNRCGGRGRLRRSVGQFLTRFAQVWERAGHGSRASHALKRPFPVLILDRRRQTPGPLPRLVASDDRPLVVNRGCTGNRCEAATSTFRTRDHRSDTDSRQYNDLLLSPGNHAISKSAPGFRRTPRGPGH